MAVLRQEQIDHLNNRAFLVVEELLNAKNLAGVRAKDETLMGRLYDGCASDAPPCCA